MGIETQSHHMQKKDGNSVANSQSFFVISSEFLDPFSNSLSKNNQAAFSMLLETL